MHMITYNFLNEKVLHKSTGNNIIKEVLQHFIEKYNIEDQK
jgi:hypothetical protein